MRQEKTFLLKLWTDSADHVLWRASLENVMTKDKAYFASLQSLFEDLAALTASFYQEMEDMKVSENHD